MCRLASHMRTISISRSRKSDPTRPCGLSYSALKSCSLFIFVDWLCACVRACGLRRFVCGHSSRPLSTGNKFACCLPAWSGRCPLTVRTEVPQQASSSIHWTAITAASTHPQLLIGLLRAEEAKVTREREERPCLMGSVCRTRRRNDHSVPSLQCS